MSTPQELESATKQKFHKAMLALHGDVQTLTKDESNPFFKSKYVPLSKMLTELKPIVQKHGFILSQPCDVANTQQGIINVVFTSLIHVETGLSDVAKLAISNDLIQGKNGNPDMQGLGGAITYARRYTLSSLLGLIEADDDGNTATGKVVKKKTVKVEDSF